MPEDKELQSHERETRYVGCYEGSKPDGTMGGYENTIVVMYLSTRCRDGRGDIQVPMLWNL